MCLEDQCENICSNKQDKLSVALDISRKILSDMGPKYHKIEENLLKVKAGSEIDLRNPKRKPVF